MLNLPFHLEGWQTFGLILEYTIKVVAVGVVPSNRKPSSASAWLMAILFIPVVGWPAYFLMSGTYISRRRHRIQRDVNERISNVNADLPDYPEDAQVGDELASIIKLNRKLTGTPATWSAVRGVYADYDATIARMAEVIDEAEEFVHIEIYIVAWDDTTDVFFQACKRAVERGVRVRLLFDHVGSWKYPGYRTLGRRLTAIGVDWHVMLPLQPWKLRFRRPDLRNHRKLLVVDNRVGFMGSQNMIDSSYLVGANKRLGRHWVDVMIEFEGPMVDSLERVFAADWLMETNQRLVQETGNRASASDGNVVQLVPSGPGYNTEPNRRMFTSLVHHAKEHLIVCSPYFIPDETLFDAITSACYRGVRVDLLVSEQSDQFLVGHAQSSYYSQLIEAGVTIHMYPAPYILHSKFVVTDPHLEEPIAAVGSSNLDMRSFGLNYEISVLAAHGDLPGHLAKLGQEYMDKSTILTKEVWERRSWARRYIDNVCRLTSALQ
ncbi:MAG: cardiolipin synthase [Corynebacterium sp.]|nr:cardiolipin synthase [Corynebacterium sp.]